MSLTITGIENNFTGCNFTGCNYAIGPTGCIGIPGAGTTFTSHWTYHDTDVNHIIDLVADRNKSIDIKPNEINQYCSYLSAVAETNALNVPMTVDCRFGDRSTLGSMILTLMSENIVLSKRLTKLEHFIYIHPFLEKYFITELAKIIYEYYFYTNNL